MKWNQMLIVIIVNVFTDLLMQCELWRHIATAVYYYTPLMALFPGLPRWAGTRKVKPIWILPKQQQRPYRLTAFDPGQPG